MTWQHGHGSGSLVVWAGVSMARKTDLHVLRQGSLTRVRYGDETLDVYVRCYAGAIEDNFILMDDNAPLHMQSKGRRRLPLTRNNRVHGLVSQMFGSKSDCHCWDMLQVTVSLTPSSRAYQSPRAGKRSGRRMERY